MDARDAPSAPTSAATEPPPGAGLERESSSENSTTVRPVSAPARARSRYSMTASPGRNGLTSSSPRLTRAASTTSGSGTPRETPCASR